ncbi:MAG: PadR family transcriptional regulator [Intestinibacillus sp.]
MRRLAAFGFGASLLDALVLSVVSQTGSEGAYGYKITQDLRQVIEISETSLYPVLRRLLKDGYLTAYSRECAGRNRRYYRLTPLGGTQLTKYRIDWRDYRDRIQTVLFGGVDNE